jgi:hypothetical protein
VNNVDFNVAGLQELSEVEVASVNGGIPLWVSIGEWIYDLPGMVVSAAVGIATGNLQPGEGALD